MGKTTEQILDILATYPETHDAACRTLPPDAYTDAGLYDLEVEKIFKREWVLIGEEFERLLDCLSSPLREMTLVSYYLGMR